MIFLIVRMSGFLIILLLVIIAVSIYAMYRGYGASGGGELVQKFLKDDSRQLIGRGGHGMVYISRGMPDNVVKVSKNEKTCRNWNDEYDLMVATKEAIFKSGFTSPLVEIITPLDYEATDTDCYIVMKRVKRPDHIDVDDARPMLHPEFGRINAGKNVFKGRGIFLGMPDIEEYINLDKMSEYAFELGRSMAALHYISRLDGYDIEVVLGRSDTGIKAYILDFDLCKIIKNYDDEAIDRMTWSLEAVPYFPDPDEQPKLYEHFVRGYKEIAKMNGQLDVATQVLDKYE